MLRPGVLWFIPPLQGRNAQHMIGEMFHRGTVAQFRNVMIRGTMYFLVMGVAVGSFAGVLAFGFVTIKSFRWYVTKFGGGIAIMLIMSYREAPFSVPIGLLFLRFSLPYLLDRVRQGHGVYNIMVAVTRYLAARLRLTSYLFGRRRQQEEFTARTWRISIDHLTVRFHFSALAEYDGAFRRVPNTDFFPEFVNGLGATAIVDATGEAVDHGARLLMRKQDAQLLEGNRKPDEVYAVAYIPPNFWCRVVTLVLLLWGVGEIFLMLSSSGPILLGRCLLRAFGVQNDHDGYSVVVGLFTLWACWTVGKDVGSVEDVLECCGTTRLTVSSLWDRLVRIDGWCWLVKMAYIGVSLGVVVPVLLAGSVDAYFIMPIRLGLRPDWAPSFQIVDVWVLGVLYITVVLDVIGVDSNSRVIRGLQQIKHNGWMEPDVVAATKDVLLPLLVYLCAVAFLPGAAFQSVRYSFPLVALQSKFMFTHIYPGVFVVAFIMILARVSYDRLAVVVREKEYVVEMRLESYNSDGVDDVRQI
ncbi:hypothetical protein AAF712_014678 [Marasmius tenuissimus]|uniref:RING-type E3 ubiquitin transferase n=1 Tax=Marasmius tenuissimus TaxID=585030 RepID=A0ABR2ZDW1_9AGAR